MTDSGYLPKDYALLFLQSIWEPGEVRELRAFNTSGYGRITFGYFDTPEGAAHAAASIFHSHEVYVTLNPVNPALLARASNRLKQFESKRDATTTDKDIAALRYLLIDLDPKRPSKISASNDEITKALHVAKSFRDKYGKPVVAAMSGNGYHLVYRHNAQDAKQLKAFLESLGDFPASVGVDSVDIDRSVFNPARITKVIGSKSCKGDSTKDRPHRHSYIVPESIAEAPDVLDIPVLEEAQPQVKPAKGQAPSAPVSAGSFDLPEWMAKNGLHVRAEKPWDSGGTVYELKECYFNPTHNRGEAAVIRCSSGKIIYSCQHASCRARTWPELRESIEGPREKWSRACYKCGEPVTWHYGDKRPRDLDGELHNCRPPQDLHQKYTENIQPPPPPPPEEQRTIYDKATGAWRPVYVKDAEELAAELERTRLAMNAPPFPVDSLPYPVNVYCKELAASMSAPLDFAGTYALATLAAAIGSTKKIAVDGDWLETPSLYTACVGTPGSMKSPVLKAFLRLISHIEANNREANERADLEYEAAKAAYEVDLQTWKAERKKGIETNPPTRPEPPTRLRFHTSNATIEALGPIMDGNAKVLVAKDELTELVTGMNQYKGGQGSDRQAWLSFWAGTAAPIDRKNREPIYLSDPCLSLCGGIQPGELESLTARLSDGLFDRFLIAWPAPIVSYTRSRSRVSEILKGLMRTVYTRLYDDREQDTIQLSQEALELFDAWYEHNRHEAYDSPEALQNVYFKAPAWLLRIALVLAMVKEERPITADTINRAYCLTQYYKLQSSRVLGVSLEDNQDKELRKVLELAKRKKTDTISTRDICRAALLGIRRAEEAMKLLEGLSQRGIGVLDGKRLRITISLESTEEG